MMHRGNHPAQHGTNHSKIASNLEEESTLQHLFGRDVNARVQKKMEEHEAAQKWTECSIEEWRAGGQGEPQKFERCRLGNADFFVRVAVEVYRCSRHGIFSSLVFD